MTNKPSVECILEDLELCLTCNNSIFKNKVFLQNDGAAQGRHMSSRILKCLKLILQLYNIIFSQQSGKDFQIIFWQFGYIGSTGKIKFTMQVQYEDVTEFLDLKRKLENSKIAVYVFAKPTHPTVSHMCYLLVATLEKISITYHVV